MKNKLFKTSHINSYLKTAKIITARKFYLKNRKCNCNQYIAHKKHFLFNFCYSTKNSPSLAVILIIDSISKTLPNYEYTCILEYTSTNNILC